MITLRKLQSLPIRTRLRKSARLLAEFESRIRRGGAVERVYLTGLAATLKDDAVSDEVTACAAALGKAARATAPREPTPGAPSLLLRVVNDLRHALLAALGEHPAEWDLTAPLDGTPLGAIPGETIQTDATRLSTVDYRAVLFLEDLRSPFNVGSIFRTAEAFGVEKILLTRATPSPELPRSRRSAMGCVDRVPWDIRMLEEIRQESDGAVIFALETGGTPIGEFSFPRNGIALIGNEELGLSHEARALAQEHICSIPMAGKKASLNVAVAVGILLSWWSRRHDGA